MKHLHLVLLLALILLIGCVSTKTNTNNSCSNIKCQMCFDYTKLPKGLTKGEKYRKKRECANFVVWQIDQKDYLIDKNTKMVVKTGRAIDLANDCSSYIVYENEYDVHGFSYDIRS